MDSVLTEYRQLAAAIQNLQPLAKGYVRVFRGQTKHHEKMLPSGLRLGHRAVDHSLFELYASGLAADLARFTQKQQPIQDVRLWLVWLQALAQHYGPGSRYMDVTKSLSVALWFALHQFEKVESQGIIGPRGPLDPRSDEINNLIWGWYSRAQAPGYIYVFDVPKWDGRGLPEHGMLVDLAEAPDIIARSTRMAVQKGCAVHALKNAENDGNLAEFLNKASPIRVSWPMTGISLPASTEELFPLPGNDDWYARFISAPLVNRLDRNTGRLELTHPVAVNLYFPERREAVADIERRIIRIAPGLLWPALVSSEETIQPAFLTDHGKHRALAEATPILLQSPLCVLTPPLAGTDWNHGLLAGDAAKSVTADDLETSGSSHEVSLCNIFLEFSPLEKAGWERVETGDWSIAWLRALWLLCQDQDYEVRAVLQSFAGSDSALAYTEPLLVKFDPSTKRFRCRTSKASSWSDFAQTQPQVAKPFFVALMVLRELTPLMKATPFPMRRLRDKDGKWLTVGGLRGAAAKLVSARDERSRRTIYLLEDIASGNMFVRPTVATGHYLEEGESWAALDAGIVRKKIMEEALRQSRRT